MTVNDVRPAYTFTSTAAYRFTLYAPAHDDRDALLDTLGFTFKQGWQVSHKPLTEGRWSCIAIRDRFPHSRDDAPPPRTLTIRKWLTDALPDVGRCDYVALTEDGYGVAFHVKRGAHNVTYAQRMLEELLACRVTLIVDTPFVESSMLYMEAVPVER